MTHTYRCVAKAGVAGRHVNPAAAALLAERPAVRVEYDEAIVAEHNEARGELIVWNFRGRTPHEEAKEFSHRHRMSLARECSTDTKLNEACARVEADVVAALPAVLEIVFPFAVGGEDAFFLADDDTAAAADLAGQEAAYNAEAAARARRRESDYEAARAGTVVPAQNFGPKPKACCVVS